MLAATARDAGAPLPLLILHDVGWPYGRRDLYYTPERIPEEFRQPYAQRGMRMDKKGLVLAGGGLNPTMYNAVREGGPRNGVMTALDDFVAEYDRPMRRVVLPIYFGLAIVVEEERLAHRPELARLLDRLEAAEGRARCSSSPSDATPGDGVPARRFSQHERKLDAGGRTGTSTCSRARCSTSTTWRTSSASSTSPTCLERGAKLDPVIMRDPMRHQGPRPRGSGGAARRGSPARRRRAGRDYFPYTDMGRVRLDHLERASTTIHASAVGGRRRRVRHRARRGRDLPPWLPRRARDRRPRRVGGRHLRRAPSPTATRRLPELFADLNNVRDGVRPVRPARRAGPLPPGPPSHTLAETPIERCRCSGSAATSRVGSATSSRRSTTGSASAGSSSWTSSRRRACSRRSRSSGGAGDRRSDRTNRRRGVCWRKTVETDESATAPLAPTRSQRAPLPPRAADDAQGPVGRRRLLQHASRGGAHTPLAVARLPAGHRGPRLRGDRRRERLRRRPEARRRVRPQLRRRVPIRRPRCRGRPFADAGAEPRRRARERRRVRVHDRRRPRADPRSAAVRDDRPRHVFAGGRRHAAVVRRARPAGRRGAGGVRPGVRGPPLRARSSGRPTATACSTSATSSATATGSTASGRATACSCPAALLEQLGGFDESFSVAGGGYANLDFYERLGSSPDVTVTTIIGEGSFHQVHGGTTTNVIDTDRAQPPDRRLRTAVRGDPRAAVPRAGPHDALRREHAAARRAHQGAPAGGAEHLQGRRPPTPTGFPSSRCRSPTTSGPRSSTRSGAATRGARPPGWAGPLRKPADRPARLPGADHAGPSRLDRRDRDREGRSCVVPRVDLRAARPRAGALDRRAGGATTVPSTRGSRISPGTRPSRTPPSRSARWSASRRTRSSCSGHAGRSGGWWPSSRCTRRSYRPAPTW